MEGFTQQRNVFHVWTGRGRETRAAGMLKGDSIPTPFPTSSGPSSLEPCVQKTGTGVLAEASGPFVPAGGCACVCAHEGYENL